MYAPYMVWPACPLSYLRHIGCCSIMLAPCIQYNLLLQHTFTRRTRWLRNRTQSVENKGSAGRGKSAAAKRATSAGRPSATPTPGSTVEPSFFSSTTADACSPVQNSGIVNKENLLAHHCPSCPATPSGLSIPGYHTTVSPSAECARKRRGSSSHADAPKPGMLCWNFNGLTCFICSEAQRLQSFGLLVHFLGAFFD